MKRRIQSRVPHYRLSACVWRRFGSLLLGILILRLYMPYGIWGTPLVRSNQSVELTATLRALTFYMTRTVSLRVPLALGGGSSLLSR
jgi:hypothetical protein